MNGERVVNGKLNKTACGSVVASGSRDAAARASESDDERSRAFGVLIDDVIREYGNTSAVVDETGTYTFDELAAVSGGICGIISESEARAGDVVGLYFDQSKEAIAATIGTLMNGCTFVPLDVNDPVNRLKLVIEDCNPSCILTTRPYLAMLEAVGTRCRVIDISARCVNEKKPGRCAEVSPDEMACIYYTSGSTGKPKGVCQTHRNLQHFVNVYRGALSISDQDRVSMLYSMNFSAANMDMFSAILSGASLHLFNVKKRGVSELRDWLNSSSISVLHTVPSVYRSLLKNTPDKHVYASIRAIDLGGEPVYASDVALLRRHFVPGVLCFNHLAATEASVISQFHVDPNAEYNEGRVPVGQPAPGVEVRIVRGDDGGVAGVGEPGEILLKSRYLSPGYLNRPELNKKVFFNDGDGVRCWHSGDMGYYDQNGDLNHVGRTDSRVKLRGHSVDLSEIESVLYRHDHVENGVVVVQEDVTDVQSRMLVAHVKTTPVHGVDGAGIRAFLAEHLPSYMQPTHVVVHDSLPMTTTGKIDRNRLPLVKQRVRTLDGAATVASTALERSLIAAFKSVLKIDTVGVDDSFYDLGGDSLLTEELLLRLKDLYGVEIPYATFAAAPTVSGIADFIDRGDGRSNRRESFLLSIQTEGTKPPLFFVPGGIGSDDVVGTVYSGLARYLGSDQPFYGLVADDCDWMGGDSDVQSLAAKFVETIRSVQAEGPYHLAGACIGGIIAYEMTQQLRASNEEVPVLFLINTEVPTRDVQNAVRQNRWKRSCRRFKRRARYIFQRIHYHHVLMKDLRWGAKLAYLSGRAGNAVVAGREINVYNRRLEKRLVTLMSSYTPGEYQGRVCILMTRALRWSEQNNWDRYIRGKLEIYQVVGRADHVLTDAETPLGQQMRTCLDDLAHARVPI